MAIPVGTSGGIVVISTVVGPVGTVVTITDQSISINPTICLSTHKRTSGSAMAEGPREALVSRNPATTKHLT